MSQEPQRYEGIIEDRTVEVVMESSYVLEALRAPVFVDDLGDFRAVGRALLEAWRERVPGFGVEMQISHGSGDAERLCSVGIVVQWIAAPEDDVTSKSRTSAPVMDAPLIAESPERRILSVTPIILARQPCERPV